MKRALIFSVLLFLCRLNLVFTDLNLLNGPNPYDILSNHVIYKNANSSDRYGLINHKNICYMSSVVTSLFNIDIFRKTLYSARALNASSVMLTQVFAKMQTTSSSIRTEFCLMPALETELKWKFGRFECILEFCSSLFNILPEEVVNLFNINVRYSQFIKANHVQIKFKDDFETYLVITPQFHSVSAAINANFIDNECENYNVLKEDWNEYRHIIPEFEEDKISVPIYSEMKILNRPEILIFGIRRRANHTSIDFDRTEMTLDLEFYMPIMNDSSSSEYAPSKYLLQAFCYHLPGHYVSYVRDFKSGSLDGDWYEYNDDNVSAVRTIQDYDKLIKRANSSATLAFYVRENTIVRKKESEEEIKAQIPQSIVTIANLMIALETVESKKSKRKLGNQTSSSGSKSTANFNSLTSSLNPSSKQYLSDDEKLRKAQSDESWFLVDSDFSDLYDNLMSDI